MEKMEKTGNRERKEISHPADRTAKRNRGSNPGKTDSSRHKRRRVPARKVEDNPRNGRAEIPADKRNRETQLPTRADAARRTVRGLDNLPILRNALPRARPAAAVAEVPAARSSDNRAGR